KPAYNRIHRRPTGERALRRARPPAFTRAKETKMTADSLQKQSKAPAGRLFQKGRSGNPSGRRPGCRNRATLTAEVLLEGEAEALTRKAIELALEGDTTALRLCLERIVPQRRSRAVAFDLPQIDRVEDLAGAVGIDPAGSSMRPTPPR